MQRVWILGLLFILSTFAILGEDEDEPVVFVDGNTIPAGNEIGVEVVAEGLNRPLILTHAGDGSDRIFIAEQGGQVWILQDGEILPTPFLDVTNLLSSDVNAGGYTERGILGLAFHPNFDENNTFFVHYSGTNNGQTVIARYQVSMSNPNVADPNSAEIFFTLAQPFANHNGGELAFGPNDGYLYISLGDGGSANDPLNSGQNKNTLLGTILRVDVDGVPYAVPEDNPFVDADGADEVWAYGLRNAWKFSFDRATGDMYVADVGQNQWEEVSFQPADSEGGINYGWNVFEGTHIFAGGQTAGDSVLPFFEYDHNQGCSVTGGYVYRGEAISNLQGVYLFGDFCSGQVWASYRTAEDSWETIKYIDLPYEISAFGEDEAGELYVLDHNGTVARFVLNN